MVKWWESLQRGQEIWSAARKVVGRLFRGEGSRPAEFEAKVAAWRSRLPIPTFWLIGKTQSGKTSIIRYLTGAAEAVIGEGYRPTTRTTRRFDFPTAEAPLFSFLDTRGLDEPGYDPQEDITACSDQAQCVIVTAKVNDPAQATVRGLLAAVRREHPQRPVLLCLTCLHEADPKVPLPLPYPFRPYPADQKPQWPIELSETLRMQLDEQVRQFSGLYDLLVPIDLTRPEDGWPVPDYGGEALWQALLQLLPEAYRQTLLRWEAASEELRDLHQQEARPVILGYSLLAATAGALPVPLVDLPVLLGLQVRMAQQLAEIYGQSLRLENYRELAAVLGTGLVVRQLTRQAAKLIPGLGSAVGAAVAFASTYALGRALCYYFETVRQGHLPDAAIIRKLYEEQFAAAEAAFRRTAGVTPNTPAPTAEASDPHP